MTMLAQTSSNPAHRGWSEQPIPLSDLNHLSFTDRDLAEDVAADCVRLLRAGFEDFETVRAQKWYKRLWLQLVEGDTRRRAQQCETVAEAQDLLAAILQSHFEYTAKTSVLASLIAEGLDRSQEQAVPAARLVIDLGDQHDRLLEQVEQSRAQGTHDPSNEYTWSEEHRLLLFKVMAVAANTDGQVAEQERTLLDFKLRDLELSPEANEQAERYLAHVVPLNGEVRQIESPEMRMVLFRHAVAVVLADGNYSLSEKYFMRHLARSLEISSEQVDAVLSELEPVSPRLSPQKVAALASLGKKARDGRAGPSSGGAPETAASPQQVQAALARLEAPLREWTHAMMGVAYQELTEFLRRRAEEDDRCFGEDTSLEEALDLMEEIFEADAMERDFSSALEEAEKMALGTGLYLAAKLDLVLDETILEIIQERFEVIAQASVDPGDATARLLMKVQEVREGLPGTLLTFVKGAAIGVTSVFLMGPLGWLAGAAGSFFAGKSDAQKADRLVNALLRAHERVWEATSRWFSKSEMILESLGMLTADALLEAMQAKSCLETIDRAQEIVEAELSELAVEAEEAE